MSPDSIIPFDEIIKKDATSDRKRARQSVFAYFEGRWSINTLRGNVASLSGAISQRKYYEAKSPLNLEITLRLIYYFAPKFRQTGKEFAVGVIGNPKETPRPLSEKQKSLLRYPEHKPTQWTEEQIEKMKPSPVASVDPNRIPTLESIQERDRLYRTDQNHAKVHTHFIKPFKGALLPFETRHFYFGTDVTEMTDDDIIEAIAAFEKEIEDLKAIKTESSKIIDQLHELRTYADKLAKILDEKE